MAEYYPLYIRDGKLLVIYHNISPDMYLGVGKTLIYHAVIVLKSYAPYDHQKNLNDLYQGRDSIQFDILKYQPNGDAVGSRVDLTFDELMLMRLRYC